MLGALDSQAQDIDNLADRLAELAARHSGLGAADAGDSADAQLARLARPLLVRLEHYAHVLPRWRDDLLRCGRTGMAQQVNGIRDLSNRLAGLDPRQPLKQGFALVWDSAGALVRNAEEVAPGSALRVQVQQGEFDAERK
jgi:exonuclease VII large subunit